MSDTALQAVMFDMDGLLVDTEPLWFAVECEVMARLGGTWTQQDQAQLVGGSLRRSVRYMLAKAAPGHGADADTVARWMVGGMVSRIASSGVSMLPGAAELLAAVAAEGLPRALVTSSERVIMDAVLAQLGGTPADPAGADRPGAGGRPHPAFQATVCGADVSHQKPDPEPYLLAAARLGADPARCAVLEDAPNGVAAAEAAGCVVVAVPGIVQLSARNGRVVVPSLREVSVPMLRDLVASRSLSRPLNRDSR